MISVAVTRRRVCKQGCRIKTFRKEVVCRVTGCYDSAGAAREQCRRHTPLQGLWHVLGEAQARAPPRPGSGRRGGVGYRLLSQW